MPDRALNMLINATDIIDVLEGTTPCARVRGSDNMRTPDHADTILWRNSLMRFLSEIDDDVTVADIRAILEDYQ